MEAIGLFISQHWKHALEVIILSVIIYNTYRYFRATRGARIFTALVGIYIGMTLLSEWLDLSVIGWLLKYVSVFLAIALVIIFQPELRRALAELGSHRFFSSINDDVRERFADDLIEMTETLSGHRTGALIAIERRIDLKQYLETGTELDCVLSPEIVYTIFYSGTTLHDGGMIVRMADERISGSGCVFPLNQRELSDQSIGLRHRAAMGITEESDAIAIVVSEETGNISIAVAGKLERDLEKEEFRERLSELLVNRDHDDDDSEGEEEEDES
ncbi:MAG: diadenylate cyclase CdaA [Verrucomicrobiota bacterium]